MKIVYFTYELDSFLFRLPYVRGFIVSFMTIYYRCLCIFNLNYFHLSELLVYLSEHKT